MKKQEKQLILKNTNGKCRFEIGNIAVTDLTELMDGDTEEIEVANRDEVTLLAEEGLGMKRNNTR